MYSLFWYKLHMIICNAIKVICLLAEESKNDANNDEHQCHANENADHRRIDVPEARWLFDLGWKQIYRIAPETAKLEVHKLNPTCSREIKSQTHIILSI